MISPQGYQLGADPKSKNPFWDENGEDSSVNRIYATATVDDKTGVPGVVTSKSVSGNDITFNFDFHNLKGERGEAGAQGPAGPEGPAGAVGATGAKGDQGDRGPAGPEGPQGPIGETGSQGPAGHDGFSPDIVVAPIANGYHMTIITESGNQEITITNGEKGDTGETGPAGPEGPQGPAGSNGVSPTAKVEQTGDNEATITVTDSSGTTSAVIRGEAGAQGPEGPQGPKGDTGETGATGATGAKGETGPEGPQGPAGPGVPAGGTAGQVLTKVDGTDYNTEWKDPEGGSSVSTKIIEEVASLSLSSPNIIPAGGSKGPYSVRFGSSKTYDMSYSPVNLRYVDCYDATFLGRVFALVELYTTGTIAKKWTGFKITLFNISDSEVSLGSVSFVARALLLK